MEISGASTTLVFIMPEEEHTAANCGVIQNTTNIEECTIGAPQDLRVSCDESGHTKFPFSYRAHVTSPTPAQGRLRIGSVLLTL